MIFSTSVGFLRVSKSLRSETQSCSGTEKSSRLSEFEKLNPGLLTHSILRSRSLSNAGRFPRGVLDPHGPNIAPLGAECSRVVHRPIFSSFSSFRASRSCVHAVPGLCHLEMGFARFSPSVGALGDFRFSICLYRYNSFQHPNHFRIVFNSAKPSHLPLSYMPEGHIRGQGRMALLEIEVDLCSTGDTMIFW